MTVKEAVNKLTGPRASARTFAGHSDNLDHLAAWDFQAFGKVLSQKSIVWDHFFSPTVVDPLAYWFSRGSIHIFGSKT